jgi:Kef-type K+ transport system membrane component KefB
MEEHINFIPLLVLLLAFGVPMVLARVRWFPIVVGEILADIGFGHSGLCLVSENPTLEIFSNSGLSYLMFLAGLEIDFNRFFPARANKAMTVLRNQSHNGTPNFLM